MLNEMYRENYFVLSADFIALVSETSVKCTESKFALYKILLYYGLECKLFTILLSVCVTTPK